MPYYDVVPLAVARGTSYTYDSQADVPVGAVVHIPYGGRQILGVVVEEAAAFAKAKALEPTGLVLPKPTMALARWIADEFVAPLGLTFRQFVRDEVIKYRPDSVESPSVDTGKFEASWDGNPDRTGLIRKSVESALAEDRSAMVVLPDLASLEDAADLLGATEHVVFHSRMTPKQRAEVWWRVQAGEPICIVGGRSVLLLPWTNLGAIVVEDEEDLGHKSEQTPMWHSRPVAFKLAQLLGSRVLFGSVAPSLELFRLVESDAVTGVATTDAHGEVRVVRNPADGVIAPEIEQAIGSALAVGQSVGVYVPQHRLDETFAVIQQLFGGQASRHGAGTKTPVVVGGSPLLRDRGLHFDLAAAVGIDSLIQLPDYRAAESAHAAGRKLLAKSKTLYLQTADPDQPAISCLTKPFADFAKAELAERRALKLPPFTRITRLRFPTKAAAEKYTGKHTDASVEFSVRAADGGKDWLVLAKGDPHHLAGTFGEAKSVEVDPLTYA